MTDLVIYGTGGFAREVAGWISMAHYPHDPLVMDDLGGWQPHYRWIGWIDDDATRHATTVHAKPVLGGHDWLAHHPGTGVVLGMGSPAAKCAVVERLAELDLCYPTILHPSVSVGPNLTLGRGCIVCPNGILTADAELAEFVTLNLAVTVAHDSYIGAFTTVAPGCLLSGGLRCGAGVDLFTGAITIPAVTIGDRAVIGAGAVVTRDVPPGVTVVGVPAKVR